MSELFSFFVEELGRRHVLELGIGPFGLRFLGTARIFGIAPQVLCARPPDFCGSLVLLGYLHAHQAERKATMDETRLRKPNF